MDSKREIGIYVPIKNIEYSLSGASVQANEYKQVS